MLNLFMKFYQMPLLSDFMDDPSMLIAGYTDVIRKPMWLKSVKSRIERQVYTNYDDFKKDMCLIFDNAITFNGEGDIYSNIAKYCKNEFKKEFKEFNITAEEKWMRNVTKCLRSLTVLATSS